MAFFHIKFQRLLGCGGIKYKRYKGSVTVTHLIYIKFQVGGNPPADSGCHCQI